MTAESVAQFIVIIMGGGIVALIPAIQKWVKQTRDGRVAKEDTAISRWKELATEKREEASSKAAKLAAYQKWYHRIWTRYVVLTGDEDTFPSDPCEHEQLKGDSRASDN